MRLILLNCTERITRGAHLAVMVGIAVVAPKFDPTKQVKSTFRVMCKSRLGPLHSSPRLVARLG
jgi:hypothetical protein